MKAEQVLRDLTSGVDCAPRFSMKYDGAPAVFFGTDVDGHRFVASKGIFNKKPIVYRCEEDIDLRCPREDLRVKMKAVLAVGVRLRTGTAVQCELLFSSQEEVTWTTLYDGSHQKGRTRSYYTFHPNVIRYHYRGSSDAAREVSRCRVGIVPHSYYAVDEFLDLKRCDKFSVHWPHDVFVMRNELVRPLPAASPMMTRIRPPSSYETAHTTKSMNGCVRRGTPFPADDEVSIAYSRVSSMKNMLLRQVLEAEQSWYEKTTFMKEDGTEVDTSHEGLVYWDGDFSCKLVNRAKFSAANFGSLYRRGWSLNK